MSQSLEPKYVYTIVSQRGVTHKTKRGEERLILPQLATDSVLPYGYGGVHSSVS